MKEENRPATEAERAQMKHAANVNAELRAMSTAFDALHKLPDASKRRAMRWLDGAIFGHSSEEPPF